MLGKLAKCVDMLAGVGVDAAVAEREARTARDQHQKFRLATAVYEELRAGLEVVPPALDFYRKELAPPAPDVGGGGGGGNGNGRIDALPESPREYGVVSLDPEPAAKLEVTAPRVRSPDTPGAPKGREKGTGCAPGVKAGGSSRSSREFPASPAEPTDQPERPLGGLFSPSSHYRAPEWCWASPC